MVTILQEKGKKLDLCIKQSTEVKIKRTWQEKKGQIGKRAASFAGLP